MDEAEFCVRISLFYNGEAIAVGTPKELKAKARAATMEDTFINLIEANEAGAGR
jgi:ABC-type Na+ transport system ATPase subunit NatA